MNQARPADGGLTTGDEERFLLELARPVSRSFYFSLRFLPAPLRSGVTLAYLLARASDTLADCNRTPVSAGRASTLLEHLAHNLFSWPDGTVDLELDCRDGERVLLQNGGALVRLLEEHPARDLISEVWAEILVGQRSDLRREVEGRSGQALTTAELDAYLYAVAGCVGEFWTRLAEAVLPGVFRVELEVLLPWARSYGEALQLINLMRDRARDADKGRVYLSGEQMPGLVARMELGLEAADSYGRAICDPGFYFPTMLPAAIGKKMRPQFNRITTAGKKISRLGLAGVMAEVWVRSRWAGR